MSLKYRSTGSVRVKRLFCVGLLALSTALTGQVFGQSPKPSQFGGCPQIAKEASSNLHRMASKAARQMGDDGEYRRGALDDLFSAVRASDELKKLLQCLSAQRASERK